ncbi:hypothetical protein BDV06DRAFT_235886 [Aspergillus oleicola]
MVYTMKFPLWSAVLLLPYSQGYNFIPDDTQTITDTRIPALYNISTTQTLPYKDAPISGFWASSFLTATDGSQYFLASGVLASQTVSAYGASILDLTTHTRNVYFSPATFTDTNMQSFNFSTPDYEFSGLPPDMLDMKLRSNIQSLFFDVTLHATSPVIYYCGVGAYNYINGTMYNWAFPASKTSGTISVPSTSTGTKTNPDTLEKIELDPENSLTWYDRVWGAAELRNGNSTFFNLYFDDSDLVLFAPLVDSYGPLFTSRSANIHERGQNWHHLVPVDAFQPSETETWTSHRTGLVYPQEWTFSVEGRGEFTVRSVVGDQEFAVDGGAGEGGATYIGFVEFEGVFDGEEVRGFGGVELRLAALV